MENLEFVEFVEFVEARICGKYSGFQNLKAFLFLTCVLRRWSIIFFTSKQRDSPRHFASLAAMLTQHFLEHRKFRNLWKIIEFVENVEFVEKLVCF